MTPTTLEVQQLLSISFLLYANAHAALAGLIHCHCFCELMHILKFIYSFICLIGQV
jgi:hypothetical protein